MWQFLAGAFACYITVTENGRRFANKLGAEATNIFKDAFQNNTQEENNVKDSQDNKPDTTS